MQYRRARLEGGIYFFTVNLAERKRTLLVDNIAYLREAVQRVKSAHAFHIDAMVILPDHLHAIWTLQEGDSDYEMRRMLIKAGFSRKIPKGERINKSRQLKGERGIWQRRYWEHVIRDDRDTKPRFQQRHRQSPPVNNRHFQAWLRRRLNHGQMVLLPNGEPRKTNYVHALRLRSGERSTGSPRT